MLYMNHQPFQKNLIYASQFCESLVNSFCELIRTQQILLYRTICA